MANFKYIYSDKEFLNMKQDAIKRTHEMQNKKNVNLNNTKNHNVELCLNGNNLENKKTLQLKEFKASDKNNNKKEDVKLKNGKTKGNGFINLPFVEQTLSKDNILLLALIFIFIKEKSENKVIIFALLYIFAF